MAKEENNFKYHDDFVEDESQMENEDDLGSLDADRMNEAVVSSTDWTTETILNQIRKENILLNPRFQRRDAWTTKRKSKFIESIILGFPIPQLVLAEKTKGKYIVLDGKQRLLSISQFASKSNSDKFETLKLTGLEVRKDLNGQTLEQLRNQLDFSSDLSAFENGAIRTVIIKNWPSESFLYHVFRDCSIVTGNMLFYSSHYEVSVLSVNDHKPVLPVAYQWQYAG